MHPNTGRVNCTNCAASILPSTFDRNGGLCEPCKVRRDKDLRDKLDLRNDRNAAEKSVWQDDSEFLRMLANSVALAKGDPKQVALNFLQLCEVARYSKAEEAQRPLSSLLNKLGIQFSPHELVEISSPSDFCEGIQSIPRPYRELFAVYYAWGVIGSDGAGLYVGSTSRNFDDEVDRGLQLLGFSTAQGIMREIRKALSGRRKDSTQTADRMSLEGFFDLLGHDFEAAVLGPLL